MSPAEAIRSEVSSSSLIRQDEDLQAVKLSDEGEKEWSPTSFTGFRQNGVRMAMQW